MSCEEHGAEGEPEVAREGEEHGTPPSFAETVEQHEDRLDDLDTRVDKIQQEDPRADRDEVANLVAEFDEVKAALKNLQDYTKDLEAGFVKALEHVVKGKGAGRPAPAGDEEVDPARPRPWVDVASPAEGMTIIAGIKNWVETVAPFLEPRLDLRDCWHQHPAVVQVLEDARWIWDQVYRPAKDAPPHQVLDWHLRAWPGIVEIVSGTLHGCKTKHCDPVIDEDQWKMADTPLEQYERYVRQVWLTRQEGRPVDYGPPTPSKAPAEETGEAEAPT